MERDEFAREVQAATDRMVEVIWKDAKKNKCVDSDGVLHIGRPGLEAIISAVLFAVFDKLGAFSELAENGNDRCPRCHGSRQACLCTSGKQP